MSGIFVGKRFDSSARYILVAICCGGIPFFFVHGAWGELLLKAYLLTTLVFYVLLLGDWKSTSELWFWKAMIPIALIHLGIVLGVAKLNLDFPQIDRLPRVTYGGLTGVLVAEVLAFDRIVEAFRPKPR
jgi:FtsH-binding integral membrane protein